MRTCPNFAVLEQTDLLNIILTRDWSSENMGRSLFVRLFRYIADIYMARNFAGSQKSNPFDVTTEVRLSTEGNAIAGVVFSQSTGFSHGWQQPREWIPRPDPQRITLSGESWYR